MSDHVIGIVAKITSKEAGKHNNLIYNLCIEEDGRDDEWYGYGWDEPQFTEGAEIEFDIEWNNDYPNVDVDSVNVIAEGEPKRSNSRSSGRSSSQGRSSGRSSKPASRGNSGRGNNRGGASKGKGKDDTMTKEEWANKDKIVRRQACMNTSIKLVSLLFEVGAVKLPTKKADQFDAVAELCNEEAVRLYDQYEEQVYGGGTQKRGRKQEANRYEDDIPE